LKEYSHLRMTLLKQLKLMKTNQTVSANPFLKKLFPANSFVLLKITSLIPLWSFLWPPRQTLLMEPGNETYKKNAIMGEVDISLKFTRGDGLKKGGRYNVSGLIEAQYEPGSNDRNI